MARIPLELIRLPDLNVENYAKKALGLNLFGIDMVREVEWRKSYLWDFKFIPTTGTAIPNKKPFTNFFPAVEVSEQVANIATETYQVPGGAFAIPTKADIRKISVSFHDDENNTLFNFFYAWYTSICSNGVTAPLTSCVKMIAINKYNSFQEVISTSAYWVFPTGELTWTGNSQSEATKYTVNFIISGDVAWTSSGSDSSFFKGALQVGYSFLSSKVYSKIFKK